MTIAKAKTLGTVTVKGHYGNGIRTSDAASQGVVYGQLLKDIPLLRPAEVLEAIPGVVVTQHSGDGKANQYFLRGYNLDHGTDFATSVDGVPVNMPTNAHGQGYTDLNFLIPEMVDRIDYRKGPYFADNGDFASAGSASIRYRDSLPTGIASLTLGPDQYRRLLVGDSWGLGSTEHGPTLLAAFDGLHENGPWKSPEDMHKANALVRLSDGDRANGWSVDGMFYDAHWNSTDQIPLDLIASGQLCRFCAFDPTDGGRSARDIVTGEWHEHDDNGYARVSAFAEHYRLQLFSDFTFFENDPVHGDQFGQQESRNVFGAQAVKGRQHTLFGHDSITEAGLQVRHDEIHVGLFDTQARTILATESDDRVRETLAGVYVQNTTTWTPWFRSLAGLRADHVSMDVDGLAFASDSGHASQGRVSPKLSLIFGPWDKTELFVNAGSGFHSNDARGAVRGIDAATGQTIPALVGSRGSEIGLRTEIVPGLQSSLAFWRLDSDSELTYSADSGTTEPNGASRRRGVEWNNHFVLGEHWLADADFAWTHARYADANANGDIGNHIPNAVPKVFSAGITAKDFGPWTADLKFRYIGRYPLSQDGVLQAPSAIVTNLRVQRKLGEHATVILDGLNLFDRKYYDIAYEQDFRETPTSAIVPDGITVHPGEPREFRLTVQYKF